MAEASPDGVEVLHEIDDLARPTRIAPEGGDTVELRYREVFTSPSDPPPARDHLGGGLGRGPVDDFRCPGPARSAIVARNGRAGQGAVGRL
jgi:hypothetical protein